MSTVVAPQNRIQPVTLTPEASGILDAIRSLAAMAVMLGHWRGLFFADYEQLSKTAKNPLISGLYFLTGFGHQSVMVFFVLSGFFIVSSILRKMERGWNWTDYAIERGVRLYIVLLPALLIGGLWDWTGIHFFNHGHLYSGPIHPFGSGIPEHRLNFINFAGNFFFLQTRFTEVLGSNGPLWSLFNEFWYYVLFPLLLVIGISLKRRSAWTVFYCVLALSAAWVAQYVLVGFVVWLSGGLVALSTRYLAFHPTRRRWIPLCYLAFCGVLMGVCLFSARTGTGWLGSDLPVGLSFALLTHGLIQVRGLIGGSGIRVAKLFAGFSYSLYLLHFPLLLLVRAVMLPLPDVRWQPDAAHLLIGSAIPIGVSLYAWGIAHFTEFRTAAARSWIRRAISQAPDRRVRYTASSA